MWIWKWYHWKEAIKIGSLFFYAILLPRKISDLFFWRSFLPIDFYFFYSPTQSNHTLTHRYPDQGRNVSRFKLCKQIFSMCIYRCNTNK